MLGVPIGAGILEIRKFPRTKMGRMYYEREGHKIFEVPFPVGEDAVYYCLIDGERHYFKTLTQCELYLSRLAAQRGGK